MIVVTHSFGYPIFLLLSSIKIAYFFSIVRLMSLTKLLKLDWRGKDLFCLMISDISAMVPMINGTVQKIRQKVMVRSKKYSCLIVDGERREIGQDRVSGVYLHWVTFN